MPNLTTLSSISMPSTCLLTATVESNTINNTANRSSTTKIPNTTPANRWLRNPMSSNALKIIVVEDIDNIPPRKRLFICPQPSDKPVIYPAVIIPITTVMAPMTAVPPTFINFLKLKSSPKANNRRITPDISPDTDTFHICNCRYLLDGRSGEYSGYDIPQYDRLL